ncbi:MAG: Ig-like domain repeat protein [Candidatus Solibacter sp.]
MTNAANSADKFPSLAPGEVAAIVGANLADSTASAAPPQGVLSGVEVRFVSGSSEFLASLVYVSPTVISFVVPYIPNFEAQNTSITLVKGGKRYAGLTSPGQVTVGAVGFETSPNPALYDEPITLTAHVTEIQGYPGSRINTGGAVTFMDGETPLQMIKLSNVITYTDMPPSRRYDISYTTSRLETGEHALWVRYSGDSSNKAGISGTIPQVVKKPEITIWSSPNPSLLGHSVGLVATFSPATCTGSVDFFDETHQLGTATIERGRALLLTSAIPLGNHPITVRYNGDGTCPALVYGPANDYTYRTTSQTVY